MSTSRGRPPRWVREGGISGSQLAHCWSVTSEGSGVRGCRSCHIVAHSWSRGDALTISQNIAFAKTCFRIASQNPANFQQKLVDESGVAILHFYPLKAYESMPRTWST